MKTETQKLNIPETILASFTEPKGMRKTRATKQLSVESPGSSGSLNFFCAKLTTEAWVFILYKCPHTSVFFLCVSEYN